MKILATITFIIFTATISAQEMKKELHPDFPIVEGNYQMTSDWSVTLDQKYNRRIEDGSLVLWRPGFTIWTVIWNLEEDESPLERYNSLRSDISDDAFDIVEETEPLLRFSYRMTEGSAENRVSAFYCFAVSSESHVQMAIYFDEETDIENALAIWRSLKPK